MAEDFRALRAWDFGQPADALFEIEQALKRPERRGAAVKELLGVLESDATFAAKQFACKKLWMTGTEIPAAVLERLLASPDPNLVEAACYSVSRRPSAAYDEALRIALGRAKGPALVAIVNLVGERRDAGSVPTLARVMKGEAAEAVLDALGKIASDEAVRLLATARAPHALLQAAQEKIARGEKDRAREIVEQLLKLGGPPHVLRGAKSLAL